jgi:hypothetical protein
MTPPKIKSVKPTDEYELIVEFGNKEKRKYDVAPLLSKDIFYPLLNQSFFKNVRVEQGGYAVVWNDEIDISEYELWLHGKVISV